MHKQIQITIEGVAPYLMTNGQLADPRNQIARELKEIQKCRNKTDEQLEEIARLSWFGCLYMDSNQPVIPGENFEAMLIESAKKAKLGPKFKAGMLCDGNFALQYEGPKSAEAMWESEKFRFDHLIKTKSGERLMRTRVIFSEWRVSFVVSYLPDLLNRSDVVSAAERAGLQIGIGSWRPRFGRFNVVDVRDN